MSFQKAVRRKIIIYLCGFASWHFVIAFVWSAWLLRFKGTVSSVRQKDAKVGHCAVFLPLDWIVHQSHVEAKEVPTFLCVTHG